METDVTQIGESSRRVQSIEMGFRILRVLQASRTALPLREVAKRSQMPPSKVHLYLVSFAHDGVVQQNPKTGAYGLGSFAIQLGLAAVRQLDVVELARDVMSDLRTRTHCAVYLSLWGERGPCIVSKADGTIQGAFAVRLGYVLPMTTTATGLIFLTHLSSTVTTRALAAQASFEGTTAGRKRDLEKQCQKVRDDGYASTIGMLHRNFAGLSVPVMDYSGEIAAALTLLAPADHINDTLHDQLVGELKAAAAVISRRMGAPAEDPANSAVA
ncbi:IclR family transcriptional regulator [Novosphingobium aquimarinum]|uniref:IclR family transcriptional regulator n=1 Tax=Novosphingobium aquimarinum TaxID=2682494 RepID=UPI0012EBB527|nr:IclR family transcriptional regulator [Novosphingobium aquimarinum]